MKKKRSRIEDEKFFNYAINKDLISQESVVLDSALKRGMKKAIIIAEDPFYLDEESLSQQFLSMIVP